MIGVLAFFAFRMKSIRTISQILGGFVYLMGIAFIITALSVENDTTQMLHGIFVPTIPDTPGAGILIAWYYRNNSCAL